MLRHIRMAIMKTTQICTDTCNDHSEDIFMQIYNLSFQIIITASWLFSLVFISPMFLGMKVTNGICVDTWTGLECFPKVMTSAVNVVVFGPLLLMVALYSRVVYTLWFKSNDGNQISNQQKVNVLT